MKLYSDGHVVNQILRQSLVCADFLTEIASTLCLIDLFSVVVVVVGVKADCLTRDLGLWVVCPPWGFF